MATSSFTYLPYLLGHLPLFLQRLPSAQGAVLPPLQQVCPLPPQSTDVGPGMGDSVGVDDGAELGSLVGMAGTDGAGVVVTPFVH